ncbi:ABC-2 type transporter [Paracholeplasma brassicae]|uniref:ABC-2 type transporter n=1 Tax=Acholeplasma brassicae TaxID=61635 RepID=U4KP51_9MOLU|nr:ABC transporter permease [Paracholeplasma brassicae]CCV66207.1 ABC-2 type transporter [Paracholeplasma brassicae]
MYEITNLTLRSIKIFIRDKTAVFFSFLSIIILLALYFLFIGKSYGSGLDFIDPKLVSFLVTSQMMGGVLVINTLTLSLGVVGSFIVDMEQRRLDAFLVTPVKRYKIILSYYFSAIIVTLFFSFIMWLVTILYVYVNTGYFYGIGIILKVSGLLVFYTFISTSIMIFIISFLKSVNAFGTLSGVLGTFVGFASGIYMPLVQLGSVVQKVASVIPFTHMTILLKRVMLEVPYEAVLKQNFGDTDAQQVVDDIAVYYGTNEIGLFGLDVNLTVLLSLCSLLAVGVLILTTYRISKRMGK